MPPRSYDGVLPFGVASPAAFARVLRDVLASYSCCISRHFDVSEAALCSQPLDGRENSFDDCFDRRFLRLDVMGLADELIRRACYSEGVRGC